MYEATQAAAPTSTTAEAWPKGVGAVTMFVEDLAQAKNFYLDVFGVPLVHADEASAVFKMGSLLVNLLVSTAAPELIEPAVVAAPDAGSRFVLSVEVDDVDAVCVLLSDRGVELLNGPMDRPWGIRTASFRDPGGHIWEIAH